MQIRTFAEYEKNNTDFIIDNRFHFWIFRQNNDLHANHVDNESAVREMIDAKTFSDASDYSAFSSSETQCRVPRQTSYSNSTRNISNSRRTNSTSVPRNGFVLTKSGKSMNSYTTLLFQDSINRFPSGMTETDHHLISLGKLII